MTLVCITMSIVSIGCSNDDDNTSSIATYVYGSWKSKIPDITITFNKNGTFSASVYSLHELDGTFTIVEHNKWDDGRWADITLYADGEKVGFMQVVSFKNDYSSAYVSLTSDVREYLNFNNVSITFVRQ